ncbi:MAG: twin-arginine translocase subunit TatC [Syntrophomonadaceae bacterium]|nr:twin-arginine translocase subunit TatC [Syntrophomonadaceae bacterium]MDH7497720.1 twin-arginine translocase subunit TatC [Syntrophomonadaceae bacterium]
MFKKLTPEEKMTLLQHLEDLRKALLWSLVAIVVAALASFSYSDQILALVQKPMTDLGLSLVYIGVTEGFYVKLKLSLLAGLILSFPVVAWQIWSFVAPALYPHERRYVYTLFPVIVVLFVVGVVFAYSTILKMALAFLVYIAGGLTPMITVDKYLSFVLTFTIPFGLVFELPVVVYFLTRVGIIGPEVLIRNRRYAIIGIFVIAAALTPGPDPVSQVLMAVPVYLLYEASVLVSKLARPKSALHAEGGEETV